MSSLIQPVGTVAQGYAANQQAKSEAAQMTQQANLGYATKQASAAETSRQAGLLAEKAATIAAQGGGSATDVGTTNIISGIKQEGTFRSLQDLFTGKAQYDNTLYGAYLKKKAGQSALTGSYLTAAGQLQDNVAKTFSAAAGA